MNVGERLSPFPKISIRQRNSDQKLKCHSNNVRLIKVQNDFYKIYSPRKLAMTAVFWNGLN